MMEIESQTRAGLRISLSEKRKARLKPIKDKLAQELDPSSTLQFYDSHIQTERECRICFDQSESVQGALVSPCKCTGTMKYVHDGCFKNWIEKQYSQKSRGERYNFLRTGAKCELCKFRLSLKYSFKNAYCQSSYFQKQYKIDRSVFFAYILFLLVDVGCLVLLCSYIASKQDFQDSLIALIVIILAFLFLTVIAVLTVYHFINYFFIESVWHLEGYYEKKIENNGNSNQIVPLDANVQN